MEQLPDNIINLDSHRKPDAPERNPQSLEERARVFEEIEAMLVEHGFTYVPAETPGVFSEYQASASVIHNRELFDELLTHAAQEASVGGVALTFTDSSIFLGEPHEMDRQESKKRPVNDNVPE